MNDRATVSSWTPAEIAGPMHDAADHALNVESFMGAARDAVIEDLCDGKIVGAFWLADVIDSAFQYPAECRELAAQFIGEITPYEITQYRNAMVAAFVDRNAKLIEDRATKLAEEAQEAAEESAHEV